MTKNILIIVIISFFLVNLLYLDFKLAYTAPQSSDMKKPQPVKSEIPCNQNCVSTIYQAIYQATSSAVNSPTATPQKTTTGNSLTVKEFFVPFGSSSSSSNDWLDVPGLQAYVDTGNFSAVKQVLFETSVHIQTGNETAKVRLYNATDQHPVWYSDVFFNTGTNPSLLVSQPITLDSGNKLYKVQMVTQLSYPATIDQARLHIITY